MIEIDGLTDDQVNLLETMWCMDTMEEVEAFIDLLDEDQQRECWSLIELARVSMLDQIEDISPIIVDLLNDIKNY